MNWLNLSTKFALNHFKDLVQNIFTSLCNDSKNDYKGLHFFEALESSAKKLGNRITLSELENELIQQTFEITLLVEIQQ